MIRLQRRVFELLEDPNRETLPLALQTALRIEHATMPPYLYSLFSLGDKNGEVADVLYSVALEEMLHMLLVGNIIKALGARPLIDDAGFPMTYPGPLPGAIGDFQVRLRAYSPEQVCSVFMKIERPKNLLDFPVLSSFRTETDQTIGAFYSRVREIFEEFGDELIVNSSGIDQLETNEFNIGQKITSACAAIRAIDLIVQQGEGTDQDPLTPSDDGFSTNSPLAHYYRFAELTNGRLKPNPNASQDLPPAQRYYYDERDQIPFDPSKVIPLLDDPTSSSYAAGSPEFEANRAFNSTYSLILRRLQQAFDVNPSRLDTALALMPQLSENARTLVAIEVGPGKFAGPTFERQT